MDTVATTRAPAVLIKRDFFRKEKFDVSPPS